MDARNKVSGIGRLSLPMEICGENPDQLAFYVSDIEKAVAAYTGIGLSCWYRDRVCAVDLIRQQEFVVDLAFNYDFLPGIEFEIISIVEGETVQIPYAGGCGNRDQTGLSHIGFHVEDISAASGRFEDSGFSLMSRVETISHSGTDRLYRYDFMDTREAFGFITKLIMRRV